jgi:hypothetical protein
MERGEVMQRVFAVFMALHGAVHAVGFTVSWGLGGPRGVAYHTTVLNGAVDVGDGGARILGLLWLAVAAAFLGVAALLWRRDPAGLAASAAILAVSLNLCLLGLPGSEIGLVVDLVLLGLLAIAPHRLVARATATEPA